MSSMKAPSAATPIGTSVVDPPRFQTPATSAPVGSGIPSSDSRRAAVGSAALASSWLTSRTGASERATSSHQAVDT